MPTDDPYDRFRVLVSKAVKKAESCGYFIVDGNTANDRGLTQHARSLSRCLCPNGAVVLLALPRLRSSRARGHYWRGKFDQHYPTCDDASEAYRALLGGSSRDGSWIDEARAFEVGFDGDDPRVECITNPKRNPYYQLGVRYRHEAASG